MLTLPYNRSRSSQGHDLYKLCRAPVTDASHQVSKSLAFWFWRRKFLKVFSIYSHGSHLGHVTLTIYINFLSPFPRMLHMKFGFDWASGFRGEDASLLWKGTSRQRSGKGAIRKRFPLQKPRWEKTKLTIRYLYHETYRKPNEQLFSQ